jgi:glycosyltransferase involved in cell wall biosynthesis
MNEKVSIIIPVFNGSNYMRDAIDSALNQSYKNCEVIVINDGSNDGGETERIAKSYGDKIRYYSKENGGVATAVNMGIELMTGEYFAWLSHDDMFTSDKIEKQMSAIHESGIENAICHGNFDFLYVEDNKRVKVNFLEQYEKKQLETSCFAPVFTAIHGSTLLIHKSHFERVGNYDETLKTTQDSEFLFRVMRNQKSVFVEDSLIISRVHKEQGQKTMKCHKAEFNDIFIYFCEQLSDNEKIEFCGSIENFYYKLYTLLKSAKPSDEIISYLRNKISGLKRSKNDKDDKLLSELGEVCIFGAGQMGGESYEMLNQYGIDINCYIDNNSEKWGSYKNNKIVNSPEYLTNNVNLQVIISVMDPTEIKSQLEKMNIKKFLTFGDIKKRLWYTLPQKINFGE